jgi:pimeloyl-ACP methyl ester carboxylesterase
MALMQAYADPRRVTEALVERYHDLLRAPGVREASLARLSQTVLEPPEPLLRRIQSPTLLLWGERDHIIPPTRAGDFLRAIPKARLARLPGVGHLPHEEAPRASLSILREFLAAERLVES